MFTVGAADRSGFRLGTGIAISQSVGDWTFHTGIDAYQATEKLGIGTSFGGVSYNDSLYGFSYYCNQYYQGGKQVSGIVGLQVHDFQFRFEDDILALPFTGFVIQDRFRTAALELRYKDFILGASVYSTDINGMTDISRNNSKGKYIDGKQISSPIYVGYTRNNIILRYGINNSAADGLVRIAGIANFSELLISYVNKY